LREIEASDAQTQLPRLLDEVERGETLIITRHGKPIARIIPEPDCHRIEINCTMASITDIRTTMPSIPLEDSPPARRKGPKY
jgi:prevent-host-death family protein